MNYQAPRWLQIAGNVSVLLSGTMLARLFTALTLIVIARQTGPEQFGQYTACLTFATLTSPLFSLGLDTWLLGNGRRSGNDEELARYISACLILKGCLGAIWLGLIVAIGYLIDMVIFPPHLLWMTALVVWLDELGRLARIGFQAGERNRTAVSLLVFSQVIVFLSIARLAFGRVEDIETYAFTQLITTGMGSVVSISWLFRHFNVSLAYRLIPSIARFTLPFGLSMFLSLVYGRADVVIIAYWLGPTAAGYYAPAISILSALVLLPLAIHNIVLPIFSQAESRSRQSLPALLRQALLLSGVIGILMGGSLSATAQWFVNLLYGKSYQATGTVLVILGGVLLARCINLTAGAALISLHLQKRRVLPQAIAALFNLITNFIIVERWGIDGVAIVFVLTESWLIIAYLWMLRRTLQNFPQIAETQTL